MSEEKFISQKKAIRFTIIIGFLVAILVGITIIINNDLNNINKSNNSSENLVGKKVILNGDTLVITYHDPSKHYYELSDKTKLNEDYAKTIIIE